MPGLAIMIALWMALSASTGSAAGLESPTGVDSLRTYEASPTVVTGAAWRETLVPMSVSTVSERELSRPGTLELAAALRAVPGLRVTRYGSLGAFAPVSVRGSSNEQVVVVVDGRRLTTAHGGGIDLGAVTTHGIADVQVVRGAATALEGPDALGGVIAIATKPRSRAGHQSVRFEGGSQGTGSAGWSWQRSLGNRQSVWADIGGVRRGDGGHYWDANRRQQRERDNSALQSLSAHVGTRVQSTERVTWTADYALTTSDRGVQGTVEFPTPEATRIDRHHATSLEWRVAELAGREAWTSVSVYLHDRFRSYDDPGHGVDDRHRSRAVGADGSWHRADGGATVVAGASFRTESLHSTADSDARRRSGALFTRWAWRQRDDVWGLGAALRIDGQQGFEPFTSWRAGITRRLTRDTTVRLGAGRAFRPPSFSDLFGQDQGFASGKGSLRPERAIEIDGGLARAWRLEDAAIAGSLGVDAFWRSTEDMIQWIPGADGIWRPHNVGLAVTRGVELEWSMESHLGVPAALRGTTTWLDARNRTGRRNADGRTLIYKPAFTASVVCEVDVLADIRLSSAFHHTGSSFITPANTKMVPGYDWWDLTASWGFDAAWTITAALLNAGDVRAVDVRDFPLPAREWRLGVRLAAPGER